MRTVDRVTRSLVTVVSVSSPLPLNSACDSMTGIQFPSMRDSRVLGFDCLVTSARNTVSIQFRLKGFSMKRDMVLVRRLLEFIEEKGTRLFKGSIPIEGYERDAIVTHVYLLADGGFVELGQETLTNKGPLVLTWKGCDYLDHLRAKESRPAQPARV